MNPLTFRAALQFGQKTKFEDVLVLLERSIALERQTNMSQPNPHGLNLGFGASYIWTFLRVTAGSKGIGALGTSTCTTVQTSSTMIRMNTPKMRLFGGNFKFDSNRFFRTNQ
jgi:hypothetical protein